ncbi:MAG TPA: cupin domain-containing protein [Streptosporangiaceae bacterium]
MTLAAKNLDNPDQKRSFEHADLNVVSLPGATIVRADFRPGFRWSTDAGPVVGTSSCEVAHTGVVLSGRFAVRMDDGTELELGPGDGHVVSPGHDAWVVGDEPCVIIDVALAPA